MGGGKSHGLIGLCHLAAHLRTWRTDIGRQAIAEAARTAADIPPTGPPAGRRARLRQHDRRARRCEFDGPARTLHERFLWRLFGGDYALYERYQPHYADKNKSLRH